MTRTAWRWAEKDFGFRFRANNGRARGGFYQAGDPNSFYVVSEKLSKLSKERIEELDSGAPTSPQVVASPWKNYEREWDWIATEDGILLNFAGCVEREEIERREDEGVARAMDFAASLVSRADPVALTNGVIRQLHVELMGAIYPFAGAWRQVGLTKGAGPEKWPLPPVGIEAMMELFERDVLVRSPFLSESDADVFAYVAEVMGELLAIHPFREGNGRTAFTVANLLLMQNGHLPLDVYNRHADESRYFAACEDARLNKRYSSMADLVAEWEEAAQVKWEEVDGGA